MIRQGFTARLHGFALGAVCLCAAVPASADDLRPKLVLPSQTAAPVIAPPSPAPAPPPATLAGPSDAFYISFEANARKSMDRPRRDALRRDFVQRFTDAQVRNATAEMQHYERLLSILTTIAAERGEKQP